MQRVVVLIASALLATSSFAGSEVDRAREAFAQRFPAARIDHFAGTPVAGIYQVGMGGKVVYVSADGRYLFDGALIDLNAGVDLSQRYLSGARLAVLAEVSEERMIIYEPRKQTKYTITTFTDIDCSYCRKMHEEIGTLTSHGIRVRYMLYSRAGVDSISYRKAVSVWCSVDRQAALTRAKRGLMPAERDCENPVREHMALARRLGLTGTPMTITDTGEQIMGYVPADELLLRLRTARESATAPRN